MLPPVTLLLVCKISLARPVPSYALNPQPSGKAVLQYVRAVLAVKQNNNNAVVVTFLSTCYILAFVIFRKRFDW